jgi:hypothetical protein
MANIKIEFIKDFATKNKGDVWEVHSQLANRLIREKVAVVVKEEEAPKRVRRTKEQIEADKKAKK